MKMIIPVIRGLTQNFLSDALGKRHADPALVEKTSELMAKRIALMPRYLGLSLFFLTVLFDWYGILSAFKIFQHQAPGQREHQIHQWKNSSFGVCRDFIRFYEKMILFVFYSLEESQTSAAS